MQIALQVMISLFTTGQLKQKQKQTNKKTLDDSISAISQALVLEHTGTYPIMSGCLTNKLKVNEITKHVTTSRNPPTSLSLPGYVETLSLWFSDCEYSQNFSLVRIYLVTLEQEHEMQSGDSSEDQTMVSIAVIFLKSFPVRLVLPVRRAKNLTS